MGQMGQQIWMGHVGFFSTCDLLTYDLLNDD